MKIISWNLRNLSQGKLNNALTPAVSGRGLGNTVLDYMMKVVMGMPTWSNLTTANPADLFIVIELRCGGHNKSQPAGGGAVPTLAAIVGAMNANVGLRGLAATYQYAAVAPLVVGRHESVGIVFNTRVLTWTASAVRRDVNGRYVNPRSPFSAGFTVNATGAQIVVTGLHAPPPSGGAAVRYRKPILYANAVGTVPQLGVANQMVMGDFNCNPASTFTNGYGVPVGWNWPGYGTLIPNGTLSSVRRKVAGGQAPPANYLSDSYDNLLFNFHVGGGAVQGVLDTIGQARDTTQVPPVPMYPANLPTLLFNYNKVSDHLPLVLEF
jgi:hypothetical protein